MSNAKANEQHAKIMKVASQGVKSAIPLSALEQTDINVRKTQPDPAGIESLAALIASQGLINPISVVVLKSGRNPKYGVIAGSRRFAALQLLVAQGVMTPETGVDCIVHARDKALGISIAENLAREAMHPADEFVAYRDLIEKGDSVDEVAVKFGTTALLVKQRMTLGNVAPDLLDLYRKGDMTFEALAALTLTSDHAAQRGAWKAACAGAHYRIVATIREALTNEEVRSDENIAKLVGVDAYQAAGGVTRADLFGDTVYFTDRNLLTALAQAQLDAAAAEASENGAAWTGTVLHPGDFAREYCEARVIDAELTAEQSARLDAAEAAIDAMEEELRGIDYDENPSAYDELEERCNQAEADKDAMTESWKQIDPNEAEKVGTVIVLTDGGRLDIRHASLKLADAKAIRAAAEKARKEQDRADKAADKASDAAPAPGISDVLAQSLAVEQTMAMQAEIAKNHRIALITLTASLVALTFEGELIPNIHEVGVRLSTDWRDVERCNDQVPASKAKAEMEAQYGRWLSVIESCTAEIGVYSWLLTAPEDTVMSLMAFCVASITDARVVSAAGRTRPNPRGMAVAGALGLNMGAWWTPTASNYFGRLTIPMILKDIEDITGQPVDEAKQKLKKSVLAAEAEALAAERNWVPPFMRVTPAIEAAALSE